MNNIFAELLVQLPTLGFIVGSSWHYEYMAVPSGEEDGKDFSVLLKRVGYVLVVTLLLYLALVDVKNVFAGDHWNQALAARELFMAFGIALLHIAYLRKARRAERAEGRLNDS